MVWLTDFSANAILSFDPKRKSFQDTMREKMLAAMMPGGHTLTVRGARELRVKESDRIASLVAGLRALGADADELADGGHVAAGAGEQLPGGPPVVERDRQAVQVLPVAARADQRPNRLARPAGHRPLPAPVRPDGSGDRVRPPEPARDGRQLRQAPSEHLLGAVLRQPLVGLEVVGLDELAGRRRVPITRMPSVAAMRATFWPMTPTPSAGS